MLHPTEADVPRRIAAAQPSLTPKLARLAAFVGSREIAAAADASRAMAVRFPAMPGCRCFDGVRAGFRNRVDVELTGAGQPRQSASLNRSPAALPGPGIGPAPARSARG